MNYAESHFTKAEKLSVKNVYRYFALQELGKKTYLTEAESKEMNSLLKDKLVEYEAKRAKHPLATTILDFLDS